MFAQDKKKTPLRQDPYYQAQAILSRRDHTEAEVRFKLRKKGFSTAQVQEVMNWLKEKKFINDETFATKYVENTLRFKAVGRRWLRFKLQQKGLSEENITQALAQYSPAEEEIQRQQAITRWQENHSNDGKPEALARFLASRGFAPFS